MTSRPQRPIAWGRIAYFAAACLASAALAYFFGDRITNGADHVGTIATIFSILSGVLIAVISILGDPSMLMDQSWRHSYLSAVEVQRRLHRNTDVFLLYVALLACLFVFSMVGKEEDAYWYLQRVVVFLTALSFFVSFTLPHALKSIQKQRLDSAIRMMKAER